MHVRISNDSGSWTSFSSILHPVAYDGDERYDYDQLIATAFFILFRNVSFFPRPNCWFPAVEHDLIRLSQSP